jgi:hypothetical protein
MIITYRPELENPPMAKECSVGFSFLPLGGARKVEYVRLNSGVTRNFDKNVWDRIKDYDNVKRMLSLGALVVTEAQSETVVAAAAPVVDGTESIESVKLSDALTLIESSFDLEQLSKWDAKESRIRVKNAIQQRKVAITEGKG